MKKEDFAELVIAAQSGAKASMDELVSHVMPRLRTYLYRITLNEELSDDLVQETLCRVVASMSDLRKTDSFWPWLFRIASNQAKEAFRKRNRLKEVQLSEYSEDIDRGGDDDADRLSEELAPVIMEGMQKLTEQQRSIVSLRCFEDMRYSQIAEIVGCKESAARISFFRAKGVLQRHLRRKGFKKGVLLSALFVFGKLTASAGAEVTASAAIAKGLGGIGLLTKLAAKASSKSTLATGAGAGVIAAGIALTAMLQPSGLNRRDVRTVHFVQQGVHSVGVASSGSSSSSSADESGSEKKIYKSKGAYETWIYFPEGPDGPVIRRDQRWNTQMTSRLCSWLQDGSANYYYHCVQKKLYVSNAPLSALVLPTDSEDFRKFIYKHAKHKPDIEYTYDKDSGLLVSAVDHRVADAKSFESSYQYNTLEPSVFDNKWGKDVPVVDYRDEMHKRGWTYFRIKGKINGAEVTGRGRVPFSYSASMRHKPWLELKVGDRLKVLDSASGAYVMGKGGKVLAAYPAGSFFKGVGRPWMGIRAYDTVRRDAAEKKIPFSSSWHGRRADIVVNMDADGLFSGITYNIDTDKDLITSLEFDLKGKDSPVQGELAFDYLQDVSRVANEFQQPKVRIASRRRQAEQPGLVWLFRLASGSLGS